MKYFDYNNYTKICTVVYDGAILKASMQPEQAQVVSAMFDSEIPFDTIRAFFQTVLGVEKAPEIPENEKTLRSMIETGFFQVDPIDAKILYRKNINLSVPQTLVDAYVEAMMSSDTVRINTLDAFWYRMGICPVDHARQDAFWFLNRQGFHIFENGLILAARNVVPLNDLQFNIAGWVDKVKTVWKQKPSNIDVYQKNNEYILFDKTNKKIPDGNFIGNLQDLANGQEAYQVYTDGYTRKTRIVMGEPVYQPRNECDHDRNKTCGRGLHFASIDHFSQSSYANSYGSVSILVAIDPIDLVAIPPSDNYWKGRCCRYLPLTKVDRDDNGNIILPDMAELKSLLGDYGNYTLTELEAKAMAANPQEVEINFIKGFTSQSVATEDLYSRLTKYANSQPTPEYKAEFDDEDEDEDEDYWYDDDDDDDDWF